MLTSFEKVVWISLISQWWQYLPTTKHLIGGSSCEGNQRSKERSAGVYTDSYITWYHQLYHNIEGWNTPDFSLFGLTIKADQWATFWRLLPTLLYNFTVISQQRPCICSWVRAGINKMAKCHMLLEVNTVAK